MKWGKCKKCGKELTDDNLGDYIGSDEILVCDNCSEEHISFIIKELEQFRRSKEFYKILNLRKKMLWISEQMGNWMDNADKTSMESVTDYDNWDIKELQIAIIDHEITLLKNLLHEDILEEKEREFNEKDKKREQLRKEFKKLLTILYNQ